MLRIRARAVARPFAYLHAYACDFVRFFLSLLLLFELARFILYLRNNNNNTFKNEMCCGKLFGFEFYGYFWQSNFHEAIVFGVFGIASLRFNSAPIQIFTASLGWIQVFLMRHWIQCVWKSHATIYANWLRLLNSTRIRIKFTLLVIFRVCAISNHEVAPQRLCSSMNSMRISSALTSVGSSVFVWKFERISYDSLLHSSQLMQANDLWDALAHRRCKSPLATPMPRPI